jgi:hypothetical protein
MTALYTPTNFKQPGITTDKLERSEPTFIPPVFAANKLSSLAELIEKHQYTLFTPAVIYCVLEQLRSNIDPLAMWVAPSVLKQIKVTNILPDSLFDGFSGKWERWGRIVYMVPTDLWMKVYNGLSGRGFVSERTGILVMMTINLTHVPDVIGAVNGKVPQQVVVHTIDAHTTEKSVVLADKIEEGEPSLLYYPPDPDLVAFRDRLRSGDSTPYSALKKKRIMDADDIPVRLFDELKPSLKKQALQLAEVYNNVLATSLDE